MNSYLAKLASDYDRALEFLASNKGEAGLKKISGSLVPGAKCAWHFEDDALMWKVDGERVPYPSQWPYQGFVIPFPETDGRGVMEPEDVCVVITDYPIEKENPVTDWAVLACLLGIEDLRQFYVFKQIVAHRGNQ